MHASKQLAQKTCAHGVLQKNSSKDGAFFMHDKIATKMFKEFTRLERTEILCRFHKSRCVVKNPLPWPSDQALYVDILFSDQNKPV